MAWLRSLSSKYCSPRTIEPLPSDLEYHMQQTGEGREDGGCAGGTEYAYFDYMRESAKIGCGVGKARSHPTRALLWGRNGFDGIESWWGGVPGSELP